eukprot:augustus_masked-scaffold_38-processed-gene-2.16-mRNA-1 protein AED:1.00 eAED:1.00 QI:0/-1/0/0/-1/1/1/0/364
MTCSVLVGAFIVGMLLPIQATINSQLLGPLNNAMAPGLVSFTTGFLFLSIFFLLRPRNAENEGYIVLDHPLNVINRANAAELKSVPKYLFIVPGFLAAGYGALAPFLGDAIGFSIVFVALVAGQLVSALISDAIGFQGLPVIKATKYRFFTVGLVIIGAFLTVVEGFSKSFDQFNISTESVILYCLLALTSGFGVAFQPAMNTKFTRILKTYPHRISWYNGLSAAVCTIPFILISEAISGDQVDFIGLQGLPFWKFLGGPIGAMVVYATIILAPIIGMSAMVTVGIAGQLIGSLIVDSFGLFGASAVDVSQVKVLGIVIVYVAVVLFKYENKLISSCSSNVDAGLDGDLESIPVIAETEKEGIL